MCTHTAVSSEQTHTHGAVGSHIAAAPGKQLGDRCLAQGSHRVGHSLPPPIIPAGPETRTHDLWVTSLTLYPLGHDCPQLDKKNQQI